MSASLRIRYAFNLRNGGIKEFDVALDESLRLIPKKRKSYPEWTKLSHHQCPNCPLKESEHPRCPIAANLVDVVRFFKDSISWEEADIEITTEARQYRKQTTLQRGISSLLGIYMVTSGCPIMDKLKPMVKTHLPFATPQETMYRAISMYLLAQYFLYRRGRKPDWKLAKLLKTYEAIRIVNRKFTERLGSTGIQDASLNAVIRLNVFADLATMALEEKGLDDIERLFQAYLDDDA